MFALMDYVRRLSTRCTCAGACLSLSRGHGTELLHLQRETGHFALRCVALFGPLSSGAIPNGIRQTGDLAPRRCTESWSLNSWGGQAQAEIAARYPLCATIPTSQGDKFTDAELPPQLPLLRDSKSFVKRISPVARGPKILPQFRRLRATSAVHRAPSELNVAYPQAAPDLHRRGVARGASPRPRRTDKVSAPSCITPSPDSILVKMVSLQEPELFGTAS